MYIPVYGPLMFYSGDKSSSIWTRPYSISVVNTKLKKVQVSLIHTHDKILSRQFWNFRLVLSFVFFQYIVLPGHMYLMDLYSLTCKRQFCQKNGVVSFPVLSTSLQPLRILLNVFRNAVKTSSKNKKLPTIIDWRHIFDKGLLRRSFSPTGSSL